MFNVFRISLILPIFAACSDVEGHDHDHDHDHEVITTVVLSLTAMSDSSTTEFTWADPDNDGSPTIDSIILNDSEEYSLAVSFLNELEDPSEDITPEISDEADEHQVFFTGTALEGASALIEHSYNDQDINGMSVGLDNTISTLMTGSGDITVTLRHLPLEDGNPVKSEGMADTVAESGFSAIGGDTDVQVTFDIEVQ